MARKTAVSSGLAIVAAFFLALMVGGARGASQPLDVEIAIDTTGSMQPAINQAQDDARKLVKGIQAFAPSAHFAIVQFKDSDDEVEYELVQPMTASAAAVETALSTLSATGGNDAPEAYNLVFHNSIDSTFGWRAAAKKVVVVIGDAEPHGAGTDGFAGCADTTADPNGISTKTALGEMKAAGRTLIMVRQATEKTTASLQCYQSLVAAAAAGGAAKNGGEDVVGVTTALVARAIDSKAPVLKALPVRVRHGRPVVLRYRVSDDSGMTREKIVVYQKTHVVFQGQTKMAAGPAKSFVWRPRAALRGVFKYVVKASDGAGHVTTASSTVRIT